LSNSEFLSVFIVKKYIFHNNFLGLAFVLSFRNLFMKYERYLDLSGDGGIIGFIILENRIFILFDNGYWYEYDDIKPGTEHIDEMKDFAITGKGLKTYINQNVRGNYM